MDLTSPHPLKELSFVSIFEHTDDVTWNAIKEIGNAVARRVQSHGSCHIAVDAAPELAPLLHALARNSGALPWDRTTITLTHEIFNDPDNPTPCATLLQDALLDHIEFPKENFFPLRNDPAETLSEAHARFASSPPKPVDIAILSLSHHKHSAGAHLLSLFARDKDPYRRHEETHLILSASGLSLDAEHFLFSFGEEVARAVRNTLHILEQTALYTHNVAWRLDHNAARLCRPPFTSAPNTLSIDVGATGIKLGILDPNGTLVTNPRRIPTPRPATPEAIFKVITAECAELQPFHRISVGFPGVVTADGVILSAPNLDGEWENCTLAEDLYNHTQTPVRIANDADVQGAAMFYQEGVELAFTLGTGFGSALALDGTLVPNLEMGHHPFQEDHSYEDLLGQEALARDGFDMWFENLLKAIDTLTALFNPNHIHLGGGNTRLIHPDTVPSHVKLHNNVAGLLGGFALWPHDEEI